MDNRATTDRIYPTGEGRRACAAACAYALALSALLSVLAAALPARADALGARELVPAYFAPEGSPGPWQAMCKGGAGSVAILNPNNGPVKRAAKQYGEAVARCAHEGWRVIGYVYTRYGARRLAQVKKAIKDYYLWYAGMDGVFLDEVADAPTPKLDAYYGSISQLVHEKGGIVVGNPGETASTPWQLEYLDTVVTFEGSATEYGSYTPSSWELAAKPQQIANIVYAASTPTRMQEVCSQAEGGGAGFVYVTDLAGRPNPYAALPSYWSAELEGC